VNAAPPTTAAPRRGARGWWLLAGLAFGLPLVACLLLWWWCGTRTDLDAAESRMRAAGLPTGGREWGRVAAAPERRAAARRIGALANALDTYHNDYWDMRPDLPVPPGLRTFQDGLPAADVAELVDTLLRIGDQPFTATVEFPISSTDELSPYRTGHFLRQRVVATSSVPEAERAARAALALMRLERGRPYAYAWFYELDRVIIHRLANGALFSPALAADLEATATGLQVEFPRDIAAETINFLTLFRTGLESTCKTLGISLPSVMETFPLGELVFRGGRAGFLDELAAYAVYLRTHARVCDWVDEAQRRAGAIWRRGMLSPVAITSHTFMPDWLSALGVAVNVMRNRLIAAVLRQGPWPEDLLDPTGRALRPLLLRGRVIGGYSVGSDGKDDGGSRSDQRFPLFRRPLGTIGE
jgi:hypothetical protein